MSLEHKLAEAKQAIAEQGELILNIETERVAIVKQLREVEQRNRVLMASLTRVEEELREREREVERLRAEKERIRSSHCDCKERADEAEAEVERLRAELNEERACHDCREFRALKTHQLEQARAEVERLRAEGLLLEGQRQAWKRNAEQAEARLARVEAAGQALYNALRHASAKNAPVEILREWRDAAAQPEEGPKPLFEAGVTLDAAGKRLQTALGHIADGTARAAQPEEKK